MSESKTYVFGQDAAGTGGANALLASVLPALCQRQAVTTRGGAPLTFADLEGEGIYEFFYSKPENLLQLL